MNNLLGVPKFLLAWTIALVLVFAQRVSAQQEETPNADFSSLCSLMERQVAAGTPSRAVAVVHHGRIVWEYAVGMRNKELAQPATVSTP